MLLFVTKKKLSEIAKLDVTSSHLFQPQLIHYFRYSKVAAYSEANSCIGELTLDIVKWLFLSVGPPVYQTFLAFCIWNALQPRDSSANREGRPVHRHMKWRCCLFICDGNKFHICVLGLKKFILQMRIKQYMCQLRGSHVHVHVLVIV